MALATYADLKSEVADLLHRSDLTAKIPTWVGLAEAELIRELKIRTNDLTVLLTTVANQDYAALPSDFSKALAVFIDYGNGKQQLPKLDYQELDFYLTACAPRAYAIDSGNIRFGAPLDKAWPISLRYEQRFALASDSDTNWVLTNHAACYLYGTVVQAAPYVQASPDLVALWKGYYMDAVDQVNRLESKNLTPPLYVDSGLTGHVVGRNERILG